MSSTSGPRSATAVHAILDRLPADSSNPVVRDLRPPRRTPDELPVVAPGGGPPRRADAVRNRERLLVAARELIVECGADALTMDAVAAAAGVGKGTLFRRFADRSGLFQALLQDGEREFQDAFLHGPPPLGPGAPASERLQTFGRVCIDRVLHEGEVMRAAMRGPLEYPIGPVQVRRLHVAALLREAAPSIDAEITADVLTWAFHPRAVHEQHELRGLSIERLHANWDELVRRVCADG